MFDICVEADDRVSISGRFDASNVDEVRAILDGFTHSVTVDLAELEYVSSSGIGVLLNAMKRLLDSGHTLQLVNVNQRIKNVLSLTGLDEVFELD